MQVYNTLGRTLQPLVTREPGVVAMYVCGPTVQSAPHVGHGRQAVAFDVIRRYLEWRGYAVTYVTNVTDVEDKIIAAAAEEGSTTEEVAARVTTQFFDAYRRLGVRPPDRLCYATGHIAEMQEAIAVLIERGHAYAAGGDVYFSVRSFPGYGKLSGHNPDELLAGARIEPGEHKRDPADFALWKGSKELGFGFDVHGGGLDLVFPHHENEVAQSEAAAGAAPFARYWLHNGMVNLRGEKMAKSTGNIVGLLDLLDEYPPVAVRLFYLRAHYRAPIDYAADLLQDAVASLERLWAFRRRVGEGDGVPESAAIEAFRTAMDDDFNTAAAMGVLFDMVREGNRHLDAGEDAAPFAAAYDEIVGVLGLSEPAAALDDLADDLEALAVAVGAAPATPEETMAALIDARSRARAGKDWATADLIRDRLGGLGIVLEDGADGTTWHRH